jgi:dUTP pyrophosphatase
MSSSQQDTAASFRYVLDVEGAVAPRKAHPEDSGYDLHLIHLLKVENGVYYYDTGVIVEPAKDYYFELVGRSSISKTGYMLANNIGIIDQNYRGHIIAALVKINPNAPDLPLPSRVVQLIPRAFIHLEPIETKSLTETVRGSGGFGSTTATTNASNTLA